ncbi:MAG: hypothetical protein AAF525_13360, partial [Pseudomonadota bacterium]
MFFSGKERVDEIATEHQDGGNAETIDSGGADTHNGMDHRKPRYALEETFSDIDIAKTTMASGIV